MARNARIRYRGLLTAALRRIAETPNGVSTADRSEIFEGLRSHHIQHSRTQSREEPDIAEPVHVIFFRVPQPDLIDVVRVLHERMEPSLHMTFEPAAPRVSNEATARSQTV